MNPMRRLGRFVCFFALDLLFLSVILGCAYLILMVLVVYGPAPVIIFGLLCYFSIRAWQWSGEKQP